MRRIKAYAGCSKFENYAGSESVRPATRIFSKPLKQLSLPDRSTGKLINTSKEVLDTACVPLHPDLGWMEKETAVYQHIFIKEKIRCRSRFDIVMGPGVGAILFELADGRLYQMPITYFHAQPINGQTSPGFPENRVMIDRPITSAAWSAMLV